MNYSKMRRPLWFLLSIAAGALSVTDKHYPMFFLAAPTLSVGAGDPFLSRHGILLGQLTCLLQDGQGRQRLPLLLLLYLLGLSRQGKRSRFFSPIVLSIMVTCYELMLSATMMTSEIDLILAPCNGILCGCALFFAQYLQEDPPKLTPRPREFCTLLIVGLWLLVLCDSLFLEGITLHLCALTLILLCGKLPLWQCWIGACVLAVAAPLISGQPKSLPIYLAGAAAVGAMCRFGRKRYAAALLMCCELALLSTALWAERLLWLIEPPLAVALFFLFPLREVSRSQPIPKEQLSQQYQALVSQVDKLQETAGKRITFYPEIAAKAVKLLQECGAEEINVTCAKDLLGGFFLDLSFTQGKGVLTPNALLGLMERSCGFALAANRYFEKEEQVFACFIRRPPYTVECAALCKTKGGETVCGDSALAFSADQSHYILLLSDGMGSGKDAFAQSRWTVTLLQKLLRAGMKAEGAIGMVHSSLKLAQQDIAFATADLCSINLQNGKAKFIKAGAVSTFILREDRIIEVCGMSMPLGASEHPDVITQKEQLKADDLLLLISDGAYHRKDEILYALQKHRSLPPRELANRLIRIVLPQNDDAQDDITVLVARFCKNKS